MSVRPLLILVYGFALAGPVAAGNLDAPAAPTAAGSAMYTLNDLYNRLNAGTAGAPRSNVFIEPAAGPGSTMHTLTEIMNKMPALDNTNGATTAYVLSGKTFWGLTSGAWGLRTGAMPTRTVSNATTSQSAGYYNAFNLATVDTDLVAGNIKSGVNIFGVAGTYNPANPAPCTCSGTTSAGGRWCDNGDGTVTDLLGATVDGKVKGRCLVWLKNANCSATLAGINNPGYLNWLNAVIWSSAVTSGVCSLTDSSVEGDWRLPTRTELGVLTSGAEAVLAGQPRAFMGVQSDDYWSSTTYASSPSDAWYANLYGGYMDVNVKTNYNYVWPVRGGL